MFSETLHTKRQLKDNLANTWLTSGGCKDISSPSVLPLSVMILEMITYVGVMDELEAAWYASDESHIAYGFNSAHSLHCEMLCFYSLSVPPLFLFGFFFKASELFLGLKLHFNWFNHFLLWFPQQRNSSKKTSVTAT